LSNLYASSADGWASRLTFSITQQLGSGSATVGLPFEHKGSVQSETQPAK